jgi:hypothetical protein
VLRAEVQKLKGEIANLAEAVATGGASIPALVDKMKERQERLTALEARQAALLAANRALRTEVKRIEKDIPGAFGELQKVFTRSSRRTRASSSRSSSSGRSPSRQG